MHAVKSRGESERRQQLAVLACCEMEERLACLATESYEAWKRKYEEAKGKPKVDLYALEATKIKPTRFTDEPSPPYTATTRKTLQIFSVKVGGIGEGLHWPLQVFSMVALRDSDPCLTLTGPVRAVVLLDPVTFEVKLTVKGTTESDDKDLSALAVPLLCWVRDESLLNANYTSKLSTVQLTYSHLLSCVEASISVLVSSGAPLDGEVPVTGDGVMKLSRHVVSVEVNGKLKVSVEAWRQGDNQVVERWKEFPPKKADRSHGMLNFGFCRMKVTVAWSLIAVD
uniref:DUF6598 domain-containing protein n=1 Tax=Setaria viridis TaxID=4556 RepID=A0A4U6VV56_SETVI|nr:hypothetical protein SEVIR_2G261700v2 [Setaria viridis]